MLATAPGKLILTGEYAVLEGAPALVVAVNRRAMATRRPGPRGSSAFLIALVEELERRFGREHPATRAATDIVVDSSAFYDGALKLGLGSSAAVTVAATALALVSDHKAVPLIDRELVLSIATAAHANAQGARSSPDSTADLAKAVSAGGVRDSSTDLTRPRSRRESMGSFPGTRGSGADVAASVYGGVIAFQRGATVDRLTWPSGVRLIPFFTGVSADTVSFVRDVSAARDREPAAVNAALQAIDRASRAALQACAVRSAEIASNALMSALSLAAAAMDQLALATRLPLVPSSVVAARGAMTRLGGTAKTTGAGGGDVAIAVIPATEDVTLARRYLIEAGCQPLQLAVDQTGVDLQPDAQ